MSLKIKKITLGIYGGLLPITMNLEGKSCMLMGTAGAGKSLALEAFAYACSFIRYGSSSDKYSAAPIKPVTLNVEFTTGERYRLCISEDEKVTERVRTFISKCYFF